ncbi:hypothetical protein PDESU_01071 [Pontiella desulfatans]|uniref:Uncharacterized protein n=1 Tax=Pontiella desulfatans TaxID=2750659 RepID=A0A6C2TXR5_PONDE|nr:hypothetical protein [Pontiella desulfatans]VGO12518.1 hypothetical protein PDESU_01071 [Pontiella desulfatans]
MHISVVVSVAVIAAILLGLYVLKESNQQETEGRTSGQPVPSVAEEPDVQQGDSVTAKDEVHVGQRRPPLSQKVDAIQQEPDYKERPGMLFDLMLEASLQEVHGLLALSEDVTYSVGFRDDMKAAAFERWYQLDPVAAIRAMDASTLSASQKNSRMEIFLEDWAGRSPQDVAALLGQGQLTGVSSDLTYGALVRGSAKNGDLEVVDAALALMDDPTLRFYALKSAARVLQRDHADRFEGWLVTLPGSDQNTALAESAWMLADQDMDRALLGLDQLAARGADELPVTRLRVAVKWADKDPVKAANWVAAQDVTGEDREILFANVMRVWISKDQSAAVAWVESLIEKGEIDEAFMNRVGGRL